MAPDPLELRISDGGFRWLLHPAAAVDVWRGGQHVGTMSGHALCLLVEHHLASAALAAAIQTELAGPATAPTPTASVGEPPRKPLAPVRPRFPRLSREAKTELRRRRRGRA